MLSRDKANKRIKLKNIPDVVMIRYRLKKIIYLCLVDLVHAQMKDFYREMKILKLP